MKSREVLNTAPASEPVTLAQVKAQIKGEGVSWSTEEDNLFTAQIKAAREAAESYTDSVFVSQTWELWLDELPAIILLPKLPLISVTSVEYYDTDDSLQTFDSANYKVESLGKYASQIHVNDNWPSLSTKREFPVKITYVVGHSSVPESINNAIKVMVSSMFNEEEMILTEGVKFLLNPYRVFK